jgi:DnaJ-domain-containing protein 1
VDELVTEPAPVPGRDDTDVAATPASERYSAWADRMRDKRLRDQARIRDTGADAGSDGDSSWHWNADTVIGRSGEHEVGDPSAGLTASEQAQRLGVLGLEPGASQDDIALAYRRQAKVHHPDRWAEADDATRQHHSEEMLRVNAAYRALRTLTIT